ncbi:MAG: DUF1836 domain-containing protein [Clostridiales bacterium]|nr:DUF1836 domain-containing protein [Clostridiales bacterium]
MAEMQANPVRLPDWERLPDLGLYMDQVVTLIERVFETPLPKGETTRSMVNNYVKSGLVPRPVGKKYDRDHLARLLMVCVLKQALSMEGIGKLLDALCRAGIRGGYERFRTRMMEMESAVFTGHIEMNWEKEPAEERALSAAIMASLCTIHTYRVLERIQTPTKEGTK